MNPCPCGYYNHPEKECVCAPGMVQKYLNRISGPLLDLKMSGNGRWLALAGTDGRTRLWDRLRDEEAGRAERLEFLRFQVRELVEAAPEKGEEADLHKLTDVANKIEGHTICALGDAAAWPVQSFLKHFFHEFEYMVRNKGRSIVDDPSEAAA